MSALPLLSRATQPMKKIYSSPSSHNFFLTAQLFLFN